MTINFDAAQWDKIKRDYEAWWNGALSRPLIAVTLTGGNSDRAEPDVPNLPFAAFYSNRTSAEAIVDRWDYELSRCRYLGDAFPSVWPNFGPGVLSAFIGAELCTDSKTGTVWFHVPNQQPIDGMRFAMDEENQWYRRIRSLYQAGLERWHGQVQMGMTDLGGTLDVLSTLRSGDCLLYDLYDHPEEVRRLTWNIHDLWRRYFEKLDHLLRPKNPGYTSWMPILSNLPSYMLQCDFSYMISPAMFHDFVEPELRASCQKLSRAFYHLDGPGELPHLDILLNIPELKGIQWVPTDGPAGSAKWGDLYRRILESGKRLQILGGLDTLDVLSGQGLDLRGVFLCCSYDVSSEKEVAARLRHYGAI